MGFGDIHILDFSVDFILKFCSSLGDEDGDWSTKLGTLTF